MAEADDDGIGPILLAACKRANMSLLKKLIEEHSTKLNPNPQDGLGNGPLHYAAMGNHLDIAQLFLDTYYDTINPDIQNFAGDTAVHKAVEKDHLDFLKLLVEYGADTTIKNNKTRDAASYAKSQAAREIIKAAERAYKVQSAAYYSDLGTTEGQAQPTGPLPIVKAELDPSMVADTDDTDD